MASASQIFVLPTAILGVGQHGPFISPVVGANFTAYQLDLNQGLGWPASGGLVMEIAIERSVDNGITWQEDARIEASQSPWFSKDRVTAVTTASARIHMGRKNGQQLAMAILDLLRFTLNVIQACGSPTITISGIQ